MPSGAACEQLSLLSAPPYAGRESEAVAGVDMVRQTPSPDPCSSPTERGRREGEGGRGVGGERKEGSKMFGRK